MLSDKGYPTEKQSSTAFINFLHKGDTGFFTVVVLHCHKREVNAETKVLLQFTELGIKHTKCTICFCTLGISNYKHIGINLAQVTGFILFTSCN